MNRFWSKVDIKGPDECWNWKAGLHGHGPRQGYGSFWDSRRGRMVKAHRYAYELHNGCIDNDLLVLHKCDNMLCVNPNHLYLGTASDNISDREARNPVSRELSGVTHTKLHEHEVYEIRSMKGKIPQNIVAKKYNVSKNIIYRLWNSDKFLCKEGYYV